MGRTRHNLRHCVPDIRLPPQVHDKGVFPVTARRVSEHPSSRIRTKADSKKETYFWERREKGRWHGDRYEEREANRMDKCVERQSVWQVTAPDTCDLKPWRNYIDMFIWRWHTVAMAVGPPSNAKCILKQNILHTEKLSLIENTDDRPNGNSWV